MDRGQQVVDGPSISRLVKSQRGGGALQPGWDSPGRLSRRAATPGAPVHILARASTEQDQHSGCGFVHHHPALDFGPRWASVVLLGWLLIFATTPVRAITMALRALGPVWPGIGHFKIRDPRVYSI